MAKVTNAFIKSKMNQDLDARLLPNGEYREGLNIQVSKSEGPDVGALENVLGNILLNTPGEENLDLKSITGVDNIKVIGHYVDKSVDTVFLFLTNYTDEVFANDKVNIKYNPSAKNFIYSFNVTTNTLIKLVEGAFLNFSTTHPIIGINVLENLLFFTDNRNQPRKINVLLANSDPQNTSPTYYTSEDNISVAKYNPYEAIQLYKYQDSINTIGTTMIDATSEYLPNGTTDNPYYDENYAGDPDFLKDKFVRFSYRFKFNDGEYSLLAPFTQEAFIPEQDGYFLGVVSESGTDVPFTSTDEQDTYRSSTVGFMENKANEIRLLVPLPYEAIEYINNEPYFSGLKVSELDIIYKESDGLAVQVVDTITIEEINKDKFQYLASESFDGEGEKQITPQWFYEYNYQGRKPYKTLPEAELIRVYDKVPVRAFSQEVSGNRVIYGNFQDKHTPPVHLNYNVAVSDKYPLSISEPGQPKNKTGYRTSAVEYPMHTVKQNRNYQVGVVLSDRFGRSSTVVLSSVNQPDDVLGKFYGSTTYHPYFDKTRYNNDNVNSWPGDSIKMVFNDQIGPSKPSQRTGEPGIYNGNPDDPNYNPLGWYSYKIVVKQTEQEYYNVYTGGIIEGDPNAATTAGNPLGTTATVSLISDNINKVPKDVTDIGPEQKQFRSEVTLFPRVTPNYDATGSGTEPTFNEPFFPTSKGADVPALAEYRDIFLDGNGDPISPLADIYESTTNPLVARLSTSKAGEAWSSTILGSYPKKQNTYPYFLSVLETNPVVSRLEIFWETSTTGLVNDLNYLVVNSENDIPVGEIENFGWDLKESDVIGTVITGNFYPQTTGVTQAFIPITDSILNSWSAFNPQSEDVSSFFEVIKVTKGQPVPSGGTLAYDSYHIKTKKEFVYSSTSASSDNYEFRFSFSSAVSPDANAEFIISNNRLSNIGPTILANDGNPNTEIPETINIALGIQDIYQFNGENGSISNQASAKQVGLNWSIQGDPNNDFTIDTSGLLSTTNEAVAGTFDLTIKLNDAGSPPDTHNIKIISDIIRNEDGTPAYDSTNEGSWCMFAENTSSMFFQASQLGLALPIAQGQQSAGYFWTSDPSNSQNNEPFDRTAGSNNLQLPGTISSDGDVSDYQMSSSCNLNDAGSPRFWSNINLTSKSKITFASENEYGWILPKPYVQIAEENDIQANVSNPAAFSSTNLSSGTMFIQVQFRKWGVINYTIDRNVLTGEVTSYCASGFKGDSMAIVGTPMVLQYRQTPEDDWQTAIDVEGNECLFGGTQQASVKPRLTFDDTYNNTGVILNNSESTIDVGEPNSTLIPSENVAQINFQLWRVNDGRDAFTDPTTTLTQSGNPYPVAVKTFVVGKDQGYFSQPDRFGDYRLLVRYPYGTFPEPVSSTNCPGGAGLIVAKSPTNCVDTVKNPIFKQFAGFSTSLSYGDFYNPVGEGKACTENLGFDNIKNPISYAYKISATDRDNQIDASYDETSIEVYAREWHCKYITRFFKDKNCSEPYIFTGYRAYSALVQEKIPVATIQYTPPSQPEGTFDIYFAFNRSDNSHSQGLGETLITSPRDNEDNRRWTANFENGKKLAGSSLANEFISQDQSKSVRKITWSNGKDIDINTTLAPSQDTYSRTINGTLEITEGQSVGPAIIGVFGQHGKPEKTTNNGYTSITTPPFNYDATSTTVLTVSELSGETVGTITIKIGPVPITPPSLCGVGFSEPKRSDGFRTSASSTALYCFDDWGGLYNPGPTLTYVEVYLNNERKPAGYQDPLTPPTLKEDPALLEILPGEYNYTLQQTIKAGSKGQYVFGSAGIFEL